MRPVRLAQSYGPTSAQEKSMPGPASPTALSFVEYLAAKKPIDDRALNARVWSALQQAISAYARPRVLEVGCGIGTMLERLIERDVLKAADYVGLDLSAENLQAAPARLAQWGEATGRAVRAESGALQITGMGAEVSARFAQADLYELPERAELGRDWDLLVGHAVLDLVDVARALIALPPRLRPGGHFYFSLVFDGLTVLEPELDRSLDEQIMDLYHETMDRRARQGLPSGDSRAGRHLFRELREAGAELLEAGSSDWVVFPRGGSYSAEEAVFLRWILHFIEHSLTGHTELDPGGLAHWLERRQEQLARAELVYLAHQLDFLGRRG
jgi:SAM-dependent methyltransferase